MLKSTYKKEPVAPQQSTPDLQAEPELAPGWTAHKAESGHTYYYNAETKKSTYVKPVAQPALPPPESIPNYAAGEYAGGFQHNNFPPPVAFDHDYGRNDRGSRNKGPNDRPKHKYDIPAIKPWVLIKTKLGRRFVHNLDTGESLWRFPEHVLKGVTDWDIKQREKKERRERGEPSEVEDVAEDQAQQSDSSEYTEVEVTDSEDDGADGPSKRQRTEEPVDDGPMEFNEDDLAAELDEMGEYGFDEEWDDAGEELSLEDAKALFFDLLEDSNINPFHTWDRIIEDGIILDDSRYKALTNMKARHDAFDEWARQKIQEQRELKATQEKRDPKIPYLAFLQDHGRASLYWPEFKRKYRKEDVMKDTKLPDKEKEKLYREFVRRKQLSQSTQKSDFTALLKSIPISALNKNTSLDPLPSSILTDLRYVCLSPSTRDTLLETYISTLPAPPDNARTAEEESQLVAKRKDRERRQTALAEREKRVEEAKLQQRRQLHYGKGQLRQEEIELERAMNVGRGGLKSQLQNVSIGDEK